MEFNKLLDSSSKLAALVAAALSVVLTVKYGKIKEQLAINKQELENKVTQLNFQQDSIDFNRKHRFTIYEKVYSAIEQKEPEKLNLAVILVTEMLPDDQYQKSLLKMIADLNGGAVSPETKALAVKTINKLDSFAKDEEIKQINISNFQRTANPVKKDYLVDVFYLESKEATLKTRADAIRNTLSGSGFDVRVRKLSDVINARAGYRVVNNQVRVDMTNPDEKEKGEEIRKNIGGNIIVKQVSQTSPGYISVFLVE